MRLALRELCVKGALTLIDCLSFFPAFVNKRDHLIVQLLQVHEIIDWICLTVMTVRGEQTRDKPERNEMNAEMVDGKVFVTRTRTKVKDGCTSCPSQSLRGKVPLTDILTMASTLIRNPRGTQKEGGGGECVNGE